MSKRLWVYEVVLTINGQRDSRYFNSRKAAERWVKVFGNRPSSTEICQWPVFTFKDI